MKKNVKKIVIGVLIISILVVLVVIMMNKEDSKYKRPAYDYVATIYHSNVLGPDSGIKYMYYIYESDKNDNEYFYIKSKSNITIVDSNEEEDIASGPLKNKNDLRKIKEDIKKDSQKNSQSYVSCTYVNNGVTKNYKDIDILENKLFK